MFASKITPSLYYSTRVPLVTSSIKQNCLPRQLNQIADRLDKRFKRPSKRSSNDPPGLISACFKLLLHADLLTTIRNPATSPQPSHRRPRPLYSLPNPLDSPICTEENLAEQTHGRANQDTNCQQKSKSLPQIWISRSYAWRKPPSKRRWLWCTLFFCASPNTFKFLSSQWSCTFIFDMLL